MMQEEDVDKFSLDEASQWLDDHNIAYENLEKIEEMVELIKIHIKKLQPSNVDDLNDSTKSRLQNRHQFMDDILRKDSKMKAELSHIYEEVIEFMKSDIGDEIRVVIEKRYPHIDAMLRSNIDELNNDECSIVVAGETSAGKSSILNLLLGNDVLPHSLLCATSTICRIHHSESKQLEIYRDGSSEIIQLPDTNEQAGEELKLKLKAIVTGRSEAGSVEYDQVDIYWPLPMLQDRVTIVDTPGIGENTRMTEKLLQYMPNAVAFIYVINSANAGGIQEDKLLHVLNEQKQWEMEGKLFSFNYASTIFVCNKWDMVEKSGEETQVWNETIMKLAAVLPKVSKDQIFKLSALEVSRHRKNGLNDTDKFQALLEGIRKLVPESLKAKVKRHLTWLAKFLDEIQDFFRARINHAKDTEEQKMKLYEEVMKRLHTLVSDAEKVKEKLITAAKQQCKKIADELHTFLTDNPRTKEKLTTWEDSQIPDIEAGDFEVTKFDAEQIIKKRINEVFNQWETDYHLVQDVSEKLSSLFVEECQLLGHACNDVSLIIKGVDREQDGASILEYSGVDGAKTDNALFTVSEKVILAVAAPLWVPLVTAASILFLPVGVGMLIHESVKAKSMRKEYMHNKAKYMQLWANQLINQYFTKEHIHNFIMASYFQCFERKINELCLDYIPKKISADRKQIDLINNDKRTAMEISSQFNPMLVKSKGISDKLRLFELKFITDNIVSLKNIQKGRRIGHGNFSDVYSARWRFQGNNGTVEKEIALKITRHGLVDMPGNSQMDELDCIRNLSHPNILEFYGICFTSSDSDNVEAVDGEFRSNSQLALLLELCENTLENKVFCNMGLHCCEFKTVPERINAFRFYCKMADGISSGLSYIHSKGYLHRDLKLSNVLVKDNTAKLCDLGFARLELALTGTFVGTITHMSPEMLSNKKYTYSTDIFSFGILLWELWYGRHAYSGVEYMSVNVLTIMDAVKNGTRPKCDLKFAMTEEIVDLVSLCWHNEPTRRPKAEYVGETVRKLFRQYHKQDI